MSNETTSRGKVWSEQEEYWLTLNYPYLNNEIIAIYLGVSRRMVERKASKMHLCKSAEYIKAYNSYAAHRRHSANSHTSH